MGSPMEYSDTATLLGNECPPFDEYSEIDSEPSPHHRLRSDPLNSLDRTRRTILARMHPNVGGIVHHRSDCRCEKLPRRRRRQPLEASQFHRGS